MSLKITVSDFKNHQICEFGQLWRLTEGEQCKIRNFLSIYKLFKIPFLTTFVSVKTLYDQIWNIFCRSHLSYLRIFRIWTFLATPGERTMHPARLIIEINIVQNDISDNFYPDYKAVQFDYKAVFYFRWKYKNNSWFFSFFVSFLQNLHDFPLFQKNYEGIFEFCRKRPFI